MENIERSARQVFSAMVGMELGPATATLESGALEASDGVVALIAIGGVWAGTGVLSCSPTLACKISANMLLADLTSVNEDVLDVVAELVNMIVGNVKTGLEAHCGPLNVSIPTVIFGRNFKTRSVGLTEWIAVRFPCQAETLTVKLCIAPRQPLAHTLPAWSKSDRDSRDTPGNSRPLRSVESPLRPRRSVDGNPFSKLQ